MPLLGDQLVDLRRLLVKEVSNRLLPVELVDNKFDVSNRIRSQSKSCDPSRRSRKLVTSILTIQAPEEITRVHPLVDGPKQCEVVATNDSGSRPVNTGCDSDVIRGLGVLGDKHVPCSQGKL